MPLELCILASGSGGNCTVLRSSGGVVLIDAGIGPRTAGKRLAGTGVSVTDVRAICLTHLDRDHFSPSWAATLCKLGVPVFCHESRVLEVRRLTPDVDVRPFDGHPFHPVSGTRFRGIRCAHDEWGSHGFVIEAAAARVGYATDLGRVPKTLIDHFCNVDLLAIESNYDPRMQMSSARPWFLKQRIMGGRGHLSNQQALEAIRAILDRCESSARHMPRHIVLLHRSRDCNCPKLLRKLFESDRRIAPRLVLAEQGQRTEWLSTEVDRMPVAGEQLRLIV